MGFCLGAYFAGHGYFDLLPDNSTCDEESIQPGAQVTNRTNTIIQLDWTFAAGPKKGTTEERWAFFQDGAVIKLKGDAATANETTIFARYASNNDIAATLTPYGKGWVANTGAHLEADKSWCKSFSGGLVEIVLTCGEDTPYKLKNPDGYKLTLGYDFVEATMDASKKSSA